MQSLSTAVDTGATGRGESAAAAADAPAQSPISNLPISTPPLTTRYTDISCPRRVWVEAARVSVVVQLTVDMPTRSAAVSALAVRPDAPVAIRLTAPAFDALNALDQPAEILPDADSPPVVFHLKPRVAGPTRLEFDFRQAGNPVGTAVVDIEITPYAVADAQEARGGFALAMPQGIAAPDLLLYIQHDTTTATPLLRFTLEESATGEVTSFEPVPLHGDAAAYNAALYRSLSRLAQDAGIGENDAALQEEIADEVRRLGFRVWEELIPRGLKNAIWPTAPHGRARRCWSSPTNRTSRGSWSGRTTSSPAIATTPVGEPCACCAGCAPMPSAATMPGRPPPCPSRPWRAWRPPTPA
ncbi:MAG: hypothetical protein M9936_24870 [Caldilinea sp.]|nr:hypothetical protein [Caldilinea sp.]